MRGICVILQMKFYYLIEELSFSGHIILGILSTILVIIILYLILQMVETAYAMTYNKPLYANYYFHLRILKFNQLEILEKQFSFYSKLDNKHKRYFEHRVASFIKDKTFVGREGIIVTDEVKVLISATACMLTFGFRNYSIKLIKYIIIYPKEFYSTSNNNYHKGEINPQLNILALSWKDFKEGFEDKTDNINLGIHEFTHAIHLNSLNRRDVNSLIFRSSFKELMGVLSQKEQKKKLLESHYLRNYAYTNQFEFLAVIIEHFIETPHEFKSKFPQIYSKIKQMLNFNLSGY